MPRIRSIADVTMYDGTAVIIEGEYRAIPVPVRGGNAPDEPPEYAVILLDDGTEVFLETFGTPAAVRAPEELQRFDRVRVAARGTIHRLMPVRGEGLLEPSLDDIESIEECRDVRC